MAVGWLLALLLAFTLSAKAITLYPTGDTYSTLDFSHGKNPTVTKRFVTKAAGRTGSLYVSKSHSAFVQFDAAAQLSGAIVTGARLTLYFPTVTKPGELDVSVVTTPWAETFDGALVAEPGYAANFAQIPAASVVAKQFVAIDVTPEVQNWVSGAIQDNGFVISSPDGMVNALLGAKEGPGSGYAATLEIDVDNVSGGPLQATTATFSSNVGIGTNDPDLRFTLTLQGTPVVINGVPNGNTTLMMLENSVGAEKWHMQLEGPNGNLAFTETGVADDRFVIAAGGAVGIGTGNPTAKLEVNGDTLVQGVVVAAAYYGDGASVTNLDGAHVTAGTVGNAALGLCKISGAVTTCGGDPTHTFVYVRGTNSLAYVGNQSAGYPYQLTLMEPGTYTIVAHASDGSETATQVTVAAGQTLTGVNLSPTNLKGDPNNCNGCGNVCPTRPSSSPACSNGACTISCNAGFGNCNGTLPDGCETNLTNSKNNCGACGNVCPGNQTCVNSQCQ